MKKVQYLPLLFLFLLLTIETGFAQSSSEDTIGLHWPDYISLDEYMQPFAQADTIVDEIILPVRIERECAEASLLFHPRKILTVRDAYLKEEFSEDHWEVRGRTIRLKPGSAIPFLKDTDLIFSEKKEGRSLPAKEEEKYVLGSEGQLFPSYQLAVTYIRDTDVPVSFPERLKSDRRNTLQRTKKKLKRGEPLKIVFFGNSIEVGGNSSGFQHMPPYMPSWPQLFVYNLRQHYSSEIIFTNQSVGGKTAQWGVENAKERVAEKEPDLVVIGFGMNDGTGKVPPEDFTGRLKSIMKEVAKTNPRCEFILVTPMLANPLSIHSQIQKEYRLPVWDLGGKHVAVSDMTVWHEWLLKYKSYQDMTGNNINHPNDYLARWYAHVLSEILIPGLSIR